MIGENEEKYEIDDELINQHAIIFYKEIMDYYKRISAISDTLFIDDILDLKRSMIDCNIDNESLAEKISKNAFNQFESEVNNNVFGILNDQEVEYNSTLLDDDDFKVGVINHLFLTKTIGNSIPFESYLFLINKAKEIISNYSDKDIGVDSILFNTAKVDPKVIPKSYMTRMMMVDEMSMAMQFIIDRLDKVDVYSVEKYKTYDDYFDYMKIECSKISQDCTVKEFYGTGPIDEFTCACISRKINVPMIFLIYKVGSMKTPFNATVDRAKDIQRKIVARAYGNDDPKGNVDSDMFL